MDARALASRFSIKAGAETTAFPSRERAYLCLPACLTARRLLETRDNPCRLSTCGSIQVMVSNYPPERIHLERERAEL